MLALSFAESFPAERRYLSKLMKLVKDNHSKLSDEEITDATGIPTGGSTGKIHPHLKYLQGMGLIAEDGDWYKLTPFGSVVQQMDRMLSVDITVWCCHAFLCSPETGSILCNELNKLLCLGNGFTRAEIVDRTQISLQNKFNPDYFSPVFSTYMNSTSFGKMEIITCEDDKYRMKSAPEGLMYVPMYGAFICHWFNTYFKDSGQVSLAEFNETSGFGRVFGKKDSEVKDIFNQVAGNGYIKISNLVNPPVFSASMTDEECWKHLFDNMI